ncbi:twitching motility protein PilT [Halopenitus persicus]|uniref:twitching motility protein PilT n=1 Tax=Halopenitus persicus TaxID=1048396 RepID=UPI000BBB1715
MAPVEADVRLFEELDRLLGTYRAVVPDAVRAELDRLADGNGREATAARVGRDLADRADPIEPDGGDAAPDDVDRADPATENAERSTDDADGNGSTNEYADDVLVALAEAGVVAYVVTNDRPLKNRILARNVPVIGLRGRNALAITEP